MKKWNAELDCEYQSISWLYCDTEMNKRKKDFLHSTVCTNFKARRNFCKKWVLGDKISNARTIII